MLLSSNINIGIFYFLSINLRDTGQNLSGMPIILKKYSLPKAIPDHFDLPMVIFLMTTLPLLKGHY